jgi:hypothetical protein
MLFASKPDSGPRTKIGKKNRNPKRRSSIITGTYKGASMTENASTSMFVEAEKAVTDVVAKVENEVGKVEYVTAEEFEKLVAEEEKIVAEATKIEHVVVQEVKQAVANVEVAAESFVRKNIDVRVGSSHIKNPG